MRAVLDPNVLIAAVLSADGAPADLLRRWLAGEFELIVSEALLDELERALAHPRIRRRVDAADAAAVVELIRAAAVAAPDPASGTYGPADPGDDYLLALAERERAVLVSGDRHLLELAGDLPIVTARDFADGLSTGRR